MHALCHCLFLPFLTPNANNVELSSTYWKSVDILFAYKLCNHKADVSKAGTQIGKILGMFRECDSGHSFLIHAVSRPVAKTLCLGPAPSASQLCNIPCSTDCIMSSWSAWGLCVHENCRDPQGRKGECLVYMCFNSSVHTDLFWLLKSSLSLLRTIFVYKM